MAEAFLLAAQSKENMTPRLTFIVPVYKPNLKVLAKAIKALCDQSLKSWEAIFVLDGENNAASEVIRSEMKKKPNTYKVILQDHAGANAARNKGQEFASGEFVVHFDCDIIIEPDTARTWLEQFDKHPEIAFVYSGYKFLDERGAIDSEPFDPWTLKVRNYISGCFPVRREFLVKWDADLKSLQDWSFWLHVVAKGGMGKFLPGHAWSTLFPEGDSISAQGCTDAKWLERIDAVKRIHGLPERSTCVSSLTKHQEGVFLAKLLDADYQDFPTWKPHRYKKIIQVGFSFMPNVVRAHCDIFKDKDVEKEIYWTCDDITEIHSRLNHIAVKKYSILLNSMVGIRQFVEDKNSQDMMAEVGFKTEIRPLPLYVGEVKPLPVKARFAVDIDPNYGPIFNVLTKSLPDVELVELKGAQKLEEFTGLAHFHPDRTLSIGMKRAALAGRVVISNVQTPFMGFIDDTADLAEFIPAAVDAIRKAAFSPQNTTARDYYINAQKVTA